MSRKRFFWYYLWLLYLKLLFSDLGRMCHRISIGSKKFPANANWCTKVHIKMYKIIPIDYDCRRHSQMFSTFCLSEGILTDICPPIRVINCKEKVTKNDLKLCFFRSTASEASWATIIIQMLCPKCQNWSKLTLHFNFHLLKSNLFNFFQIQAFSNIFKWNATSPHFQYISSTSSSTFFSTFWFSDTAEFSSLFVILGSF